MDSSDDEYYNTNDYNSNDDYFDNGEYILNGHVDDDDDDTDDNSSYITECLIDSNIYTNRACMKCSVYKFYICELKCKHRLCIDCYKTINSKCLIESCNQEFNIDDLIYNKKVFEFEKSGILYQIDKSKCIYKEDLMVKKVKSKYNKRGGTLHVSINFIKENIKKIINSTVLQNTLLSNRNFRYGSNYSKYSKKDLLYIDQSTPYRQRGNMILPKLQFDAKTYPLQFFHYNNFKLLCQKPKYYPGTVIPKPPSDVVVYRMQARRIGYEKSILNDKINKENKITLRKNTIGIKNRINLSKITKGINLPRNKTRLGDIHIFSNNDCGICVGYNLWKFLSGKIYIKKNNKWIISERISNLMEIPKHLRDMLLDQYWRNTFLQVITEINEYVPQMLVARSNFYHHNKLTMSSKLSALDSKISNINLIMKN